MVFSPPITPLTRAHLERTASNNAPFNTDQDDKDAGKLIKNFREKFDTYDNIISRLRTKLQATDENKNALPKIVQQHDGTLNLKRMARDITSIVLPGGGAKGIAYVALMKELGGIFPHAKQFIGSSAGSLAAIFMSFGEDPDRTQNMLAEEFPKLFDTQKDLRQIYPSLHFHDSMPFFARAFWRITGGRPPGEANEFVKKLDEVSSKATSNFLKGLPDKDLEERVIRYCEKSPEKISRKDEILNRLISLKQPADFSQNREAGMITFSDIDLLHSIDPKRFKDVQVTGFDIVSRKVKYFNVAETPNMPLAYAARSSMSHPLLATGVYFDKNLDETGNVYIDGGIASNIPSEAVYNHSLERAMGEGNSIADEEVRAKTIVMRFDESYAFQNEIKFQKKNIFKRLISSIIKYLKNWFINLVSHNPRAETHLENDRKKFRAAKQNGYILYHGDLHTTETNVDSTRQNIAINEATIGLLSQALKNKEQGYSLKVDTVKDAYKHLSEEEINLICEEAKKWILEEEKKPIGASSTRTKWLYSIAQAKQKRDLLQEACMAFENNKRTTDNQRLEAQKTLETAQNALEQLENEFKMTSELYALVVKGAMKHTPKSAQNPTVSFPHQMSTTFPAPTPVPLNASSLVMSDGPSLNINPPVSDELRVTAAAYLNEKFSGTVYNPSLLTIPSDSDEGISTVYTLESQDDFSDQEA